MNSPRTVTLTDSVESAPHSISQPPVGFPRRFGRRLASLPGGRILLFFLLFLAFFPEIHPPDADLDPSWRMMLGYALAHNFQFGHEFIFTYGPLGFLASQTYSGHFTVLMIGWHLALATGSALLVMRLMRSYGLTQQVIICLFFLLILSGNTDQLYMVVLLLAGINLLSRPPPSSRTLMLTAVVLAVFSLIKFTQCLLAGSIILVVCGEAYLAGRRRSAALLGGAYGAALLVLWLLCGQNPLRLPEYFFRSLEISRGYGETMGIATPPTAFVFGIVAVLALVLYAVIAFLGSNDRRLTGARILIFAAATFLAWKHGFVRSDGHMVNFFVHSLLVAVLFPLFAGRTARLRPLQVAALIVSALASIIGLYANFPLTVTHSLAGFEFSARRKISTLLTLPQAPANLRGHWRDAARAHDLERTREVVGTDTLDVLGHFQGVALLNDLNFLPRPVPQSYSAYTPRLAALNTAHYESDHGPQWVIQRIKTIDGRFPTLDDAGLQLALVRNYTLAFEEGPYLIWRRSTPDDRFHAFKPTPAPERTGRLGEAVPLDELGQDNLWARIEVRPTLLGRLRSLVYKPAPLELEVVDSTGRAQRFRLLREVAASGFLLNPLLRDQYDWLRFIKHLDTARIASLKVRISDKDRAYYRKDFSYHLDSLPPPPHRRDDQDGIMLAQTGAFRNLPVSLAADAPLGPIQVGGEQAVLIHAPSEMVFNIGAAATSFRARYGIADSAYVGEARTAGATIVVEWQSAEESRMLFERRLSPLDEPADRGLHELDVDLSPLGAGTLIIRSTVGPSNAWAWTAWRDLEILPVSAADRDGQPILTGSNHIITRYGRFAAPLAVSTGDPVITVMVDGISMIQAHADSEIGLQIPPDARRVVGRFAIQEAAYTGGAATDGAEFSVVWKSGDDERILFRRYLDPFSSSADRGVQKFSAELGHLPGGGTLLLRTHSGPNGNSGWDWTCWSDVQIGNPPDLPDINPPAKDSDTPAPEIPATIPASMLRDDAGFEATPIRISALIPPAPARIGEHPAVQVHPPSEMVFALGEAPTYLHARYGLQQPALDQTDGVDYIVEWKGPNGESRSLFQRSLRPLTVAADRAPQSLDLSLAGLSGGTLHLRIESGDVNSSAFDWAGWQGVEILGDALPPAPEDIPFVQSRAPRQRSDRPAKLPEADLVTLGFSHSPVEWQAYTAPVITTVFDQEALQIHAPGLMVIPLPPKAHTITGRFGLQDGSYMSKTPSDGATFIVEFVADNGTRQELFRRTLQPLKQINERGLHEFSVTLDNPGSGDLHFRTEAGPDNDLTSDWTCWQGIVIE